MTKVWRENGRQLTMLVLLIGAVVATQALARRAAREDLPPRRPLHEFPAQVGAWHLTEEQTLAAAPLQQLNADEVLLRTYTGEQAVPIFLFIAYYRSQRYRQAIHTPRNCLPGAGWIMGDHRVHALGPDETVNEYAIEKDGARMLAFYWYQGRGRVIAGDYLGRWLTIEDAIRRARTDGALVRVILPLGGGEHSVETARGEGLRFISALVPTLPPYLPR